MGQGQELNSLKLSIDENYKQNSEYISIKEISIINMDNLVFEN